MLTKKIRSIRQRNISSIEVVDNDLNSAIRIWKRMLKENNTIEECYDRKFFQKPSRKKRDQFLIAQYIENKNASTNS